MKTVFEKKMTKKVSEKMMTKILVRKEVTNRRGVVPQILQIWGTRTRSLDDWEVWNYVRTTGKVGGVRPSSPSAERLLRAREMEYTARLRQAQDAAWYLMRRRASRERQGIRRNRDREASSTEGNNSSPSSQNIDIMGEVHNRAWKG